MLFNPVIYSGGSSSGASIPFNIIEPYQYANRSLTRYDSTSVSSKTMILDYAFWQPPDVALYQSYLKKVDFPEVVYIGAGAFTNNRSLSSAVFPKCQYIGAYAFANCLSLDSFNLSRAKYVGSSAFQATNLAGNVTFPDNCIIDNDAFYGCRFSRVYLPSSVCLGSRAFAWNSYLEEIYCDTEELGVTGEDGADDIFLAATNLSLISMPHVKRIRTGCFEGATHLVNIDFPEVTWINLRAFASCHRLSYVSLPNCQYIGAMAFSECKLLTGVIDLPRCYSISQSAFWSCSKMSAITMGSLISSGSDVIRGTISYSAFIGCTLLSYISASFVVEIGSSAFYNCQKLENATFFGDNWPSALADMKTGIVNRAAFAGTHLRSFIMRGSWAEFIGGSNFYNCTYLSHVSLRLAPNSKYQNAQFSSSAFYNCQNLRTVNITTSMNGGTIRPLLADHAFAGCVGLESVVIDGYGCEFQYGYTFYACPNIKYLKLSGMSSLPRMFVTNCTDLVVDMSQAGSLINIDNSTFYNCTIQSIYVPASLYSAFITASYWSDYEYVMISI